MPAILDRENEVPIGMNTPQDTFGALLARLEERVSNLSNIQLEIREMIRDGLAGVGTRLHEMDRRTNERVDEMGKRFGERIDKLEDSDRRTQAKINQWAGAIGISVVILQVIQWAYSTLLHK